MSSEPKEKRRSSIRRLLYPGVRVKRYLAVVALGFFLLGFAVGVAAATHRVRFVVRHQLIFSGVVALGMALVVFGAWELWRSVNEGIGSSRWTARFYSRHLARGPKVVAMGGGTGLPAVLRGLKNYTGNLTAVVTVADNGGSSGRLRGALGILPPGDIRNCMVALADTEPLMERLFQYRFEGGELAGHSFGNLFLAAMEEAAGDFVSGLRASSHVLAVRGRVLPATLDQVELSAELDDGQVVVGESQIGDSSARIRRVWMNPADARPLPETIEAIKSADLIVLGPGSLYTSVIPNLLVQEVVDEIHRSPALVVYVANVMTQPGETSHFSVEDHVEAITHILGKNVVDVVLVNNRAIPPEIAARYSEEGAEPVVIRDPGKISGKTRIVAEDLLLEDAVARHDPEKLAKSLLKTLNRFYPEWAEGHFFDSLWLDSRLRERKS